MRCGAPLYVLRIPFALRGAWLLGSKALIALNVLVYALGFAEALAHKRMLPWLGADPALSLVYGALPIQAEWFFEEPWRAASATLVHYGLLHLVMNLFALANLSRVLEPTLGTGRFVVVYALSGILGFLATIGVSALSAGSAGQTAGASGAVFGAMGALLGVMLRRRDPRWKNFAVQTVVMSVILGYAVNASGSGFMVNNSAHVGGLLTGAVLGYAFDRMKPPGWGAIVAGALCLGALAMSLVAARMSPVAAEIFTSVL